MKIIDITREIFSAPVFPGDTVPSLEWKKRIPNGDEYNYSQILLGAHSGTHADAPLHFIDGGGDVLSIPNDALIGECQVIEVPSGIISAAYVERYFPPLCERLLVKSAENKSRPDEFWQNEESACGQSTFMDSAAEEAAMRGLKLIGTDALSVAPVGSNPRKAHLAFLRKGIVILEGLDLSQVAPGRYFLVAAPLKLEAAEAAPARVFLIEGHIFWTGL